VSALALAIAALLVPALAAAALAQADGAAPGVGTAVPFVGTEGSTLAEITIDSVVDPFEDYDPNSPPDRAYHVVLLTITVANTGSRPFAFDPNAVAIQDADGFLSRPRYVPRTEESLAALPDYPAGEVPPGDTVSGALAYQALNGLALHTVVYLPASDRLVVLASLTRASTASVPADTDADAATAEASADTAAGDGASQDASASGLDCAIAEDWATGTGERLDSVALLVEELETFDRDTADPARLAEMGDEFQALANDQATARIPPELAAANDGFVDAYEAYAAAFAIVAQAAEDGDIDAVATAANADVAAANTVLSDAAGLAQTELAACGLS